MNQASPPNLNILVVLARAAHEVNRSYCEALDDGSQVPWELAPESLKTSTVLGVTGVLLGNGPEESHVSWFNHKTLEGWVYGPVKDFEKKTHPCMLPYAELPVAQRKKDDLFVCTIRALASALDIPITQGCP